MKFLVDNQLPLALSEYLRDRAHDCIHVLDIGLGTASDKDVCLYAEAEERIIITKDEDFFYFANQPQTKIKVIWVRLGNCRNAALLQAFEHHLPAIEFCLAAGDPIVEIR